MLLIFLGRKEIKKCYEKVKKAFDAQFIGRHNVIYERFSRHYQELEETVKPFRGVVQSCSGHFLRGIIIADLRDRGYWASPSSLNTH